MHVSPKCCIEEFRRVLKMGLSFHPRIKRQKLFVARDVVLFSIQTIHFSTCRVRYVRICSSSLCDNIKDRSFNSLVIHEERIFDFLPFEICQSEWRVAGEFKFCFLKGRVNFSSNYLFTFHLISTLTFLLCKKCTCICQCFAWINQVCPIYICALLGLISFKLIWRE
jgi:hypothetical protein